MAFSEEYFIHVQGEQKGPYTFPQLKRLYDTRLIPEETLYWRDGMEQLEPVSDLCGGPRKDRMRRLRTLRATGLVLIGVVALVVGYFGPVFQDGWRELNAQDQTPESAYWKARGFVRENVKKQDANIAFESYNAATVTLTGTVATVILPSMLFGKAGAMTKKIWQVRMQYDSARRAWLLPEGAQ